MNASRSSYVEYGTGNMLNLDAGTIKRKIDSNEYDDEILQEAQPNGKRACSVTPHANQFATFGKHTVGPLTPNGQEQAHSAWPSAQSNPSPLLRTAVTTETQSAMMPAPNGFAAMHHGYHTPESAPASVTPSPLNSAFSASMDMDMETTSGPTMFQNTSHPSTVSSAMATPGGLLPSALPGQAQQPHQQQQQQQPQGKSPYVPVHGRSMEIPSYARVPLNEVRQYRDQRWSSCIYGADTRIGQGMMI
ncbi:unnamed protein product [Mortierella alpina]